MNLSALSIKRPVATIMLLLIVVVLGGFSMFSIPLDLMPAIEMPVAMVMTNYSDASPEEIENMVTAPLESVLASVEGMQTMISYSMEGTSIIAVQFDFDSDMNFSTLAMREKIALVSDYLPDKCSEPMVMKMDMNSMPVVQLYISSDDMTLSELNNTVETSLVSRFERASGVASVDVSGGVTDEIAVKFNQEKLSAYGLSLANISQLLAAENINLPSGEVSKGSTEVLVRTIGEFKDVNDIKNLPLTIADQSIVRLGDISTITQGPKTQDAITRIDGKTAIGVMISKQSDANTVVVSNNVSKVLSDLRSEYPDLNFVVGMDQADFIKSSISSVSQAAILGALLAMVVVFLFLRNMRTTMIVAISIPTSLLATFAIMNWRGITLNIVTLCALSITVGMLVDNSIVVLENIFRTRTKIADAKEASIQGSKEIFLAIVASTLTTVMVFLPIAASSGIASLMFSDFCWTIVIALLASLVVAITVIPMLCSKIMRGTISTEYIRFGNKRYKYRFLNKFALFIEKVTAEYDVLIRGALRKRKKVIVSCLLIFVISISLIFTVGMELLPETDEGSIGVTVDVPYGTSLKDLDKVMTKAESYILGIPEVEHLSMTTGSTSTSNLMSSQPTLSVVLVDKKQRDKTSEELAKEINDGLSNITEADIKATATASISSLFGTSDLSVMIKGKDIEILKTIGNDLSNQLDSLDYVESAELDVTDGNPEIQVIIDRNAASHYGITAYQIANSLSSALSGTKATDVTVNGNEISVNLSLEDNAASSVESLKQILVSGSYGTSVPVGQIASFEFDNAPTVIGRDNQINYITLNVNVAADSLTGGSKDVLAKINDYPFPDGYYVNQSGSYDQMIEAFTSLSQALVIAIALVFLLLAAQFESVLMSLVVMMSVPFAMSGAFLALFLTGTALSMTSFLGLVMLVGIVVNNSILLVEFIRQNEDEIGIDEALVQAGKLRLRPILMSSLTTCVGMIPLSLGFGDGGEMLAPMAISIIGGMIASTVVTLILIPVLYSIINDRKNRKLEKRHNKDIHIAELEADWQKEDIKVEH